MCKVLIVGMTEGIGGVETFISNLKKNISEDIHMDFLVHQDINKKYDELLNKGSRIYKVTGIKSNIFKYLIDIFKFYKTNKYDVVHINECDAKMFLYAIPLLFDKKTKVIIHSHSTSANFKFVHDILKVLQNRRANVKIACSDEAYDYMYGKKCDNKIILHNGISLDEFSFDFKIRKLKRKELDIREKEIAFCSVARFTKEKNHEKIVDVFFEYNKMNKNSKMFFVGTGPLEDEIKNKVADLGISDKVFFLGTRDDVNELLSAFDVFLLPSLFEGLPFVALEGQACSLVFFASTNVSREIAVTDLVHFIELEKNSFEWAKIIFETLKNSIDRKSMKYHNQIKNSGFDIKSVCREMEKIYKE